MKILFFLLILFELSFSYGQYGNTDKFPVYSIKPDSITKGYVDQSGLKQGSFFSYNKNVRLILSGPIKMIHWMVF